jgi:hypothetical protein
LAVSPQVRVEGEVMASISRKRAVTLLAHAIVCPTMMALPNGPGRRKKSDHGFDA